MKQFPFVLAAGFLENLPILDIIKAGAAGLAVLVALLSYKLTREVIKGQATEINANLAKFSWKASLALVSIMVAAELLRYVHPAPALGIQASGWNPRDFGAPLNVHIWERELVGANNVGSPFSTDVNSIPVTYVIKGTSPSMTIHLDGIAAKLAKVTEVAVQLSGQIQKDAAKQTDAGPAKSP